MKYPSTKNVFLILISVLLVVGVFLFAEYKNKQAKSIYSAPIVVETDTIPNDAQKLDTDGDGVPDWEEILIGTNPKDAKSKTNSKVKSVIIKDLTQNKEKLDQIDVVSREFFARYMELHQAGISTDKASQQDLAIKTAKSIVLQQYKIYKISEILTKVDSSNEAVKQYGNEVGSIFKKYAVVSRNEAVIAKDAMDKENKEILKEIDPVILSYKNMLDGLLRIKAPQTMAQIHLDMVNALSESIFVAEILRKSDIDPIAGLQGAGSYLKVANDFNSAFNAIKSYIAYLGITYTTQEGGIVFVPTK